MKLSISNIAWSEEYDEKMYMELVEKGINGLEIAPTRIIQQNPYSNISLAKDFFQYLRTEYKLIIPSMQSLWNGRSEKLFGSYEERQVLTNYTKKAIDFAKAIECKNIVFGCPRNRYLPVNIDPDIAMEFFKEVGDYAHSRETIFAIEANPPIYNTNYINTTKQAIELVKKVNSKGFKVNLDTGTMIENNECVDILDNEIDLINHIHVSEPNLVVIKKRTIHRELAKLLLANNYNGFVSVEMGQQENINEILDVMDYIKEVFS